jgi:hypothetical protein
VRQWTLGWCWMCLFAAAIWLGAPSTAAAQSTDAAALVRAYLTAINSGNVDAAVAVFAPNATLQIGNAPPFATGSAQIRQWVLGEIAAGTQNRLSGTPQVSGNAVTWAHLQLTPASAARNQAVEVHGAGIVQGGVLGSVDFSDMSNETLAYFNTLSPLTAPAALRLPATGSVAAGPGLGRMLAGASAGLVLAGALLSRRRR